MVILLACLGAGSAGAQGGAHRAGLVVQYADGSVDTVCVRFDEPEITGLELLQRSGLSVVSGSDVIGGAVCKIGPDGCDYPAEGCFCRREGARSIYWAFYVLDGDAWAYANVGASALRVRDGDVHGWAWGLGESGSGATPPVRGLDAICGPAPTASAPTEPPAAPARPETPAAGPATAPPQPAATAPPAPAETPAPAATPAPAGQAGGPWGYAGFAAIVLVLGAGAAIVARRRA